jgi:hypothetical protein
MVHIFTEVKSETSDWIQVALDRMQHNVAYYDNCDQTSGSVTTCLAISCSRYRLLFTTVRHVGLDEGDVTDGPRARSGPTQLKWLLILYVHLFLVTTRPFIYEGFENKFLFLSSLLPYVQAKHVLLALRPCLKV